MPKLNCAVATDKDAIWIVICSRYDVFRRWSKRNGYEPTDPRFRVFHGRAIASHARYKREQDRLWILYRKRISWDYKSLLMALLPAGYHVYEDEHGEVHTFEAVL